MGCMVIWAMQCKGLAVWRTKPVLSFLSYFKTLSIGPASQESCKQARFPIMYLYTNLNFPHPWWEGHLLFLLYDDYCLCKPARFPVLYLFTILFLFYHDYYLLEASQGLKHFYYIHFEITGYPCNLIGSQQCDLFLNRTIFCSKSHLFQIASFMF